MRNDAGTGRFPLTVSCPGLLADGGDEQFRQFVHDLLAFSGKLQAIRDRMGELIGLSGPSYTILISIAHLAEGGEVGVMTIARHLNISQPFVTAEVNKLVAEGLVDKSASERDGRSVSLTVTGDGFQRLVALAPRQRAINDRLFEQLDAASFRELSEMAERFVRDADSALELMETFRREAPISELSSPPLENSPPLQSGEDGSFQASEEVV